MALGADPSYSGQSRIYTKQQPENVSINGNTVVTEEVVDTGGLLNLVGGIQAYKGAVLPSIVSFAIAQGASTGLWAPGSLSGRTDFESVGL
jgi:hypothetical protein